MGYKRKLYDVLILKNSNNNQYKNYIFTRKNWLNFHLRVRFEHHRLFHFIVGAVGWKIGFSETLFSLDYSNPPEPHLLN